jgi:hypothetical protein
MGGWWGLYYEGRDAYRATRLRDAALLWRRAAAAAREIGDAAGWFQATVWAAEATYLSGDPPAALALLLDARQREPDDAPAHEAWFARCLLFDIVRATRPQRARLGALLADLRAYAAGCAVPAGDLPHLEAVFCEAIGDWQRALDHWETAWQRRDGTGRTKSEFGNRAAALCLRLDRWDACRDWIEAIGRAGDDQFASAVALVQTQRRIDLALATGAPHAELAALLRALTDQTLATQRDQWSAALRDYAVRVHLLDPGATPNPAAGADTGPATGSEQGPADPAADPAHPLHPARAELRHRHPDRHDVHSRFDARLLFLDYRLACLRHAARLPPRDDKYHRQPDALTRLAPAATPAGNPSADQRSASAATPAKPPDLATRLDQARAAAGWAMAYAQKLDGWLQCDWRQRAVTARRERIEAIAAAVGLGR